jgi:hypothetical protein
VSIQRQDDTPPVLEVSESSTRILWRASCRSPEVSENPRQAPLQSDFPKPRKFWLLGQVQPELTFRALSLLLIVFLGVILVVLSLVSMWKENRFGWPLRGIIWFTVAIIGSCAGYLCGEGPSGTCCVYVTLMKSCLAKLEGIK